MAGSVDFVNLATKSCIGQQNVAASRLIIRTKAFQPLDAHNTAKRTTVFPWILNLFVRLIAFERLTPPLDNARFQVKKAGRILAAIATAIQERAKARGFSKTFLKGRLAGRRNLYLPKKPGTRESPISFYGGK